MGSPSADHHVERFVLELLSTGLMLSGLVSDLSAALPADAYPSEEPRTVVIEMLCGTMCTALTSADWREVQRATELIALAGARTLEHLQLALDLSRRIHADDGPGRTYG
jgi:hypothetical protein